mgnify:CR=1 FL=1|tara:strand:+ start:1704 stop:2363 length:660 start_codon:yes stop_codon:yes gene_type:complete
MTNTINNKLEKYFWEEPKKLLIHKWHHYFEVYDRHFKRFRNSNPTILEIGVSKGGSLEMWNYYFDNKCKIYGVDVDPECKKLEQYFDNVTIFIGDQGSPDFWKKFKQDVPRLDILIDDGGHTMQQQITTYEQMYSHVQDDGVYLCEDVHTSYFNNFGGGLKNPSTFIEYSKSFLDDINAYHANIDLTFRKTTHSVHFYDSIVVLEKRKDDETPTHSQRT